MNIIFYVLLFFFFKKGNGLWPSLVRQLRKTPLASSRPTSEHCCHDQIYSPRGKHSDCHTSQLRYSVRAMSFASELEAAAVFVIHADQICILRLIIQFHKPHAM